MNPWHFFKGISVVSFGPFLIATEDRQVLAELAHNKTAKGYVNAVWAARRENMGATKPVRSLEWPKTCLIDCPRGEHGYLLCVDASNVTALRDREAA